MMTVEEKPDVTYSDIGGCKEQIEKMREVVELPMLHPEKVTVPRSAALSAQEKHTSTALVVAGTAVHFVLSVQTPNTGTVCKIHSPFKF